MSRAYYAEINLHMVWHTKNSLPLLVLEVEQFTHHYIRGRLNNTPGVYVHEIGGIETHVHVAISIPPTIGVSELIGQLKGSSSHEANQQVGLGRKVLEWQHRDRFRVVPLLCLWRCLFGQSLRCDRNQRGVALRREDEFVETEVT